MKKTKLFCWIYVILLIIPALTMTFKSRVISEIDNTYLPEFSLKNLNNYIEKRIGFRSQAILAYEIVNDRLFKIFEPQCMYGRDDEMFCYGDAYISDYIHTNIDESYIEDFSDYIGDLSDIAKEKQVYFLYVLCTDKKTIYSESYVEGLNIRDNPSRSEMIISGLDEKKVNYIYTKDFLIAAKNNGIRVYNQKYDVSHWNDNGAFVISQEIFRNIKKYDETIPVLTVQDFDISIKTEQYLQNSQFTINEQVPLYTSHTSYAERDTSYDNIMPGETNFFEHYVNNKAAGPKILIFRDSYLDRASKFFVEYFAESTFASYGNLTCLKDYEEYIDILQPDIVIFENVERTLPLAIPK